MKTTGKRLLSLLLCLIMVLALVPMNTFAVAPPMQNVSISEEGILSWDPVPGAAQYMVLVGYGGGVRTETSYDLYEACADYGFETGDYTVKLYAVDSARNTITETWTGSYHYVSASERLAKPTNLRFEGKTCKWDAVPHAPLYMVLLLNEEGSLIENSPYISATEYSFSLELGKSYKFKVCAEAKGYISSESISGLYTYNGIEISQIPITAEWNSDCTKLSSFSTTEPGCCITKVEMVKNGTAISEATPGDTINVAFTVQHYAEYYFASNCHAYWNGAQETAKIVGSADYEKRFTFKVTVPTPGIEPMVEAVTITDIDKPVIGQHPDTTFRIMSANELGLTGSATWYEYKNGVGGSMSTDDVFREGYTYGCSISIAALNRTFRYTTETDDYGDEYDVFDGTLTVNGTASTGYVSMSATRLSTRWWSGAALPVDCGGDPAVCPGAVFTDMPAYGNWAHNPIDWAVTNGITSGTSTTKFSPNKTCTRGQIVTFLWRAAGKPEPTTTSCDFTDVKPTDYFYKAVLWAVEAGITKGTSATTFGPNKDCTRGQIVTFLWRAKGEPKPTNTNHSFTDIKSGEYYYTAVLWAVEKGVTSGTSKTAFSPNESCTRAQAVTFLYRAFN